MKIGRDYEVSYTVTYKIVVTANSESEAINKASDAESWEWNDDDASDYKVIEIYDEEY